MESLDQGNFKSSEWKPGLVLLGFVLPEMLKETLEALSWNVGLQNKCIILKGYKEGRKLGKHAEAENTAIFPHSKKYKAITNGYP